MTSTRPPACWLCTRAGLEAAGTEYQHRCLQILLQCWTGPAPVQQVVLHGVPHAACLGPAPSRDGTLIRYTARSDRGIASHIGSPRGRPGFLREETMKQSNPQCIVFWSSLTLLIAFSNTQCQRAITHTLCLIRWQ